MSRAYRIKVREILKRVLRAADGVSTQLELLEILPPEQMAELLENELRGRGFKKKGDGLVRKDGNVVVTVVPQSGTVKVAAEASECVEIEGEKQGSYYGEGSQKQAEKATRDVIRKDLETKAEKQESALQKQVTDQLESQLGDLRKELDQVVNRVTAEALKRKAAQLGQIKEITEDKESGSMTIVLEV
jgi:hypothetical protein